MKTNIPAKKRILILNTGGTISCRPTPDGLKPEPGFVERTINKLTTLQHPDLPDFVIKEYRPLLDSSNIGIPDWNQLAEDIQTAYHDMDGFIIFHGTDTLAYTASALSFMLENLGKPVILTGAQLPFSHVRSDGIDNTITSLLLCAYYPIYEVCVYFNQRLLRGNRARKLHTNRLDAFDSPNYPHLASIGIDIRLHAKHLLHKPRHPFRVQPIHSALIAHFKLVPGFDLSLLETLLQRPLRALIIETYGAGNAPDNHPHFLALLKQAKNRNIVVINSTQCLTGRVEMSYYATGLTLAQMGAISAADLTPEALYCKILYACSKTENVDELRQLIQTPHCGEMSTFT